MGACDAYLTAPDGTRLRSTTEVIHYLVQNNIHDIDPRYVNMDKTMEPTPEDKPTNNVKKMIAVIECLKRGEKPDLTAKVKAKPAPKPKTSRKIACKISIWKICAPFLL